MKRQRKFRVTPELLDQMFTAKEGEHQQLFKGITSDLPDDTRIVAIWQGDRLPLDWVFVVESDSFDPMAERGDPLEMTPIFTAHYDDPPPLTPRNGTREGTEKKGGQNLRPLTPRPAPPQGQGGSGASQ